MSFSILFQEFALEVVVRPGQLNVRPDHLSRINTGKELTRVEDDLPDAHLFRIEVVLAELEEIAQFLENGQALDGMSTETKQILAIKFNHIAKLTEFCTKWGWTKYSVDVF